MTDEIETIEIKLLLEALHQSYHYDFRAYAMASLTRRLRLARERLDFPSLSAMQERLLRDPTLLPQLLDYLTVQVSDLFRDPAYFLQIRETVLPHLRTYPSLKVWIAGCGAGEELYSFVLLFREEGLEERTLFYATDINPAALARAQAGVYDLGRFRVFTENHRRAGGKSSLSDYYTAAYGAGAFDKSLRNRVVFSDHSLATDEVFSEMHLISCRNVLIYFDPALQTRALGLFRDSLAPRGFLGLGARETLRFSEHAGDFDDFARDERIYRLKAGR
jgi:chemotaxis protein methyltransferase CheR